MLKRVQRIISALFAFIIVISVFCVPVSADCGPKPTLKVRIVNPPDSKYCVALLTYKSYEPSKEDREKGYDKFYTDGYGLFLSPVGTNIHESNETGVYGFHYMVPWEFKVIVITDNGDKYVSNLIKRNSFHSECTFNVSNGVLKEEAFTSYNVLRYSIPAVLCFVVTILSEMLVLLWFRLSIKKNLKQLFFINIVTQIFLNVVTFFINIFWVWAAAELVIIIVESAYYRKRLVNRDGEQVPGRNVAYGIVANLFSLSMELPMLLIVYLILMFFG